jgi:Leucine-rich repeat (LRR) protein
MDVTIMSQFIAERRLLGDHRFNSIHSFTSKVSLNSEGNIVVLNLNALNLKQFSSILLELPDLIILKLENNKITDLPEVDKANFSIQDISLSKNDINEIPKSFKNLIELRVIDLSFNKFRRCPEILKYCPLLELIVFYGNPYKFSKKEILTAKQEYNLIIKQ